LSEGVPVVLGLGSNRGDCGAILRKAIADLSGFLGSLSVSSLYRTKPQDYLAQDDFLNMTCSGVFYGTPRELLASIQTIEVAYGRNRSAEISKGPRPLDIDILLFGDRVIRDSDLVVPHERMHLRQFALVPLLEIMPECADPVTGVPYRTICDELGDQGVLKAGNLNGN